MAELKMTSTRIALLRSARDGDVYTIAGSGRAWLGVLGRGREVTSRVDELREADLIAISSDDADLDLQAYTPTSTGEKVLADLDAKEQ